MTEGHSARYRAVLLALVAFSSCVGSTSAVAQVPTAISPSSMSVCGKDLQLGLGPKAVFDKFDGTECVVYKVAEDPDLFAIGRGGREIATVKFSHGLLATITREWAAEIKSVQEFGRAVVNALQEVQAHGSSQCVLSALNQANPSFEARGTVMKCGRRTLVFSVDTESGQEKFLIEEIVSE